MAQEFIPIIRRTAESLGLDPDLAEAVAFVESSFNPQALRFEPKWAYFYKPETYAGKFSITIATEKTLQAMSWGCMQVMGAVARELGLRDHLLTLSDPVQGIVYGCKKLAELSKIYEAESAIIASYNAGSPRKIGLAYSNQAYVDKVSAELRRLRSIN